MGVGKGFLIVPQNPGWQTVPPASPLSHTHPASVNESPASVIKSPTWKKYISAHNPQALISGMALVRVCHPTCAWKAESQKELPNSTDDFHTPGDRSCGKLGSQNGLLPGRLGAEHSRSLPGQGKGKQGNSEMLETPGSGCSLEGLRGEWWGTGLGRQPGWSRELLVLRRGLDFSPKTAGTSKGSKPGRAGAGLHLGIPQAA